MQLETIIGLETHIQLKTKSKMFCSCNNDSEQAPENTNICPVCLAHPGALPVANQEALISSIKTALALDCKIHRISQFDRKNYFYPDLPKAYQISQFGLPIGHDGTISFYSGNELKKTGIERLHLEEDAAKLVHPPNTSYTLIDFNRGGTPLIEIVSRPDLRNPQEAKSYLKELKRIVRYLGVSDADMEKGHLRCDANISLRPKGDNKLYPKTEIKNLNSFRSVERALTYETKRQSGLWQAGTPPNDLTTRGWDDTKQQTYIQREKEESHDYRYFPEPDLPPLHFQDKKHSHAHTCQNIPDNEINIACLRSDLPETPTAKIERFRQEYHLTLADSQTIADDQYTANYTEEVISELRQWIKENTDWEIADDDEAQKKIGKLVGGWITSEIFKLLKANNLLIENIKMKPHAFAELLGFVITRKVNSTTAKNMLEKLIMSEKTPNDLLEEENISVVESEDELKKIIETVLKEHAKVVEEYKKGKENSIQFLIGQVMKATKGMADPEKTAELIKKLLQ